MAKIGRMMKDSMVQELASGLDEKSNLIVTSVRKLTPADSDALRQKLFGAKARLRIFKATLGKRVLAGLKVDGISVLGEVAGGSLGFVIATDDALPAAKHLIDFLKDHADHLSIQGALVEGQVFDRKNVEALAALPPKAMLLAQVVVTIESPIADVAFTVERLIGDVCWIMEQLAEKKPAS
jgi:large subunit ribosomal protein L10